MDEELKRQALLGRMAAFGQRVTAQGQAYDEETAKEVHASLKKAQPAKPAADVDELDDLLELAPTGSFAFSQRPQGANDAPSATAAPAASALAGDELDDLLL
jgi:hypothetical protein